MVVTWDAAETVTTRTSTGVSLTSSNITFAFNNAGWITVAPGGEVAVAFVCDVSPETIAEVWVRATAGWAAVDLGMTTTRSGRYATPTVGADGTALWVATVQAPPTSSARELLVVKLLADGAATAGYAEDAAWTLTDFDECAYPALAFDPVYGDPYLLYSGVDPTSGRSVLCLSVYLNTGFGRLWYPMTVYDEPSGSVTPTFGALAVGTDGLAITWKNEAGGGNTVRALYAPRGARFFDATAVVGGDVAGIDAGDRAEANDPSVVLNQNGDLYVAWQQAGSDAGVSIWVTATDDPAGWGIGAAQEVSVGSRTRFYQYCQLADAGNLVAGVSELGDSASSTSRTDVDAAWFIGRAGATPGLDEEDAEGQVDGQREVNFAVFPTIVMEGTTLHVAWAEYDTAGGALTIRYQRGEVSYV